MKLLSMFVFKETVKTGLLKSSALQVKSVRAGWVGKNFCCVLYV